MALYQGQSFMAPEPVHSENNFVIQSNKKHLDLPNVFKNFVKMNSVPLSSVAWYTLMVYMVFPGEGSEKAHDSVICFE